MDEKKLRKNYNKRRKLRNEILVMLFLLLIFCLSFSIIYFLRDINESDKNKTNDIITTYTIERSTMVETSKELKHDKIKKTNIKDDFLDSNYKKYDITIRLDGKFYYLNANEFTDFIIENSDKILRISIINSNISVCVSDEEIERMARSIYAETRDGTFEDSLSVAATMVNCYKYENIDMFKLISDNRFANPDYGGAAKDNFNNADIEKNHQYYLAAIMALAGADPTGGCNAFYMPSDPIDYECWHESLEYRYTSPNKHRFFFSK